MGESISTVPWIVIFYSTPIGESISDDACMLWIVICCGTPMGESISGGAMDKYLMCPRHGREHFLELICCLEALPGSPTSTREVDHCFDERVPFHWEGNQKGGPLPSTPP